LRAQRTPNQGVQPTAYSLRCAAASGKRLTPGVGLQVDSVLQHRPVEETDRPLICSFPQTEDELFFLFPKAVYPLAVK